MAPRNSSSKSFSERRDFWASRNRAYGIGTTNVVIEPGATVATKLQSWIGSAASDTRFSVRDVR